ncbi:MAG: ABC transporter substrate-binding protein [bacterium]
MRSSSRTKRIMLLMSIAVFLVSFSLPAAFAQKSEVLFWTGHSGQPERGVMDQMVARFNELFPEINVKKVVVPGTETDVAKLLTSLAAGVGPDAYHLDRFTVSQRASAGILQSLERYVPGIREWVEETYLDFGWKEVVYQDKVWALPFDTDVRALYYRKDFFDEAGLSAPATIAETDAAAEKLMLREAGKLQRMGFVPWWNQGWHYTWGWAFGGEFYNADTQKITANDPRIVESFAWQKSYLDKYGMKDVQAFSSSYETQMEVLDPFVSGKVAMVITGDWFIGNMRRFGPDVDYGIVPIPRPAQFKDPTSWSGGWSIVIPVGAKNAEGAATFMKWYCGLEANTMFAEGTFHLPVTRVGAATTFLREEPGYKVFIDVLPYSQCRPVIPVGGLYWDELTAARDYVIYGKKTAQKALDDATAKVQAELDRVLSQ